MKNTALYIFISIALCAGAFFLWRKTKKSSMITEIMVLGLTIENFDASEEVLKEMTFSEVEEVLKEAKTLS